MTRFAGLLVCRSRLGALTEFFNLVPSGGSDWHGAMEGPRVLGAMRVPLLWLEQHMGMPPSELESTLEHRSGLLGLTGASDMKAILESG